MSIAETIRQAREDRGLTQEDLAEQCEVSRQAVSKWELGTSVPTPENLNTLAEVLEVTFETEEGGVTSPLRRKNPWKIAALVMGGLLGGLMLAALLSIMMYLSSPSYTNVDVPRPMEPLITGVWFFAEDGTPLEPDLGDGWKSFTVGQRVYLLAGFQNGTENGVVGVSLFATPTGTETYDEREQLAVQAVYDRDFALFPLEFSETTMIHLDIMLECGGGQTVTETLNVTAVPEEEIGSMVYNWNSEEEPPDGSVIGELLDDPSSFPVAG